MYSPRLIARAAISATPRLPAAIAIRDKYLNTRIRVLSRDAPCEIHPSGETKMTTKKYTVYLFGFIVDSDGLKFESCFFYIEEKILCKTDFFSSL